MRDAKVIDSTMVEDYKPKASIRKALSEFDALQNYRTKVCGKPPYTFIRLNKEAFSDLSDLITRKSDKRRSIRDVTYKGLPIINEREEAPA